MSGTVLAGASGATRERVRAAETTWPDGAVDIDRDRALVERCQAGDRSAFEDLYRHYHRRLYQFCLRRLHEQNEAEDAVQEAFTKAWRAIPRFAGDRRFYPWLTVIAGNVCTDVLRRRSRVTPVDDVPQPMVDVDTVEVDERLMASVDAAMATQAMQALCDRHRRVLELREGSGWSTREIAEHEGVAVPAAEILLWRARQALKREFAALANAGGRLGALVGIGLLAVRRFAQRAAHAAHRLPGVTNTGWRSPGTLLGTLVVAGGMAAGGAAIATSAGAPHAPAVTHVGSIVPAAAHPASGGAASGGASHGTPRAGSGGTNTNGSTSNGGHLPSSGGSGTHASTPSSPGSGSSSPTSGLPLPTGGGTPGLPSLPTGGTSGLPNVPGLVGGVGSGVSGLGNKVGQTLQNPGGLGGLLPGGSSGSGTGSSGTGSSGTGLGLPPGLGGQGGSTSSGGSGSGGLLGGLGL